MKVVASKTLLKKYKNLIVLRTLSKVGLAALRVGFMVAHEDIVNEVNKVRLPFNVNSLSQEVAVNTLKKGSLTGAKIKTIVSERKRLVGEMGDIEGVEPYPSDANVILFGAADSDAVYRMLLKEGILIRNMKGAVDGCLRVTVGTPKENTLFLKTLKNLL